MVDIIDSNKKIHNRCENFIVAYFFFQAANLLIKTSGMYFQAWDYISKGALVVFLLLAIIKMTSRQLFQFFAFDFLLGVCFCITYLRGTAQNYDLFYLFFNACFVFFPLGFCVYFCEYRNLLRKMYIFCWPIQIMLLFVLLSFSSKYSMPAGYALVFQVLIITDHFFASRKWYDLIPIIVDIIAILLNGSRGPLLCFLCYVVMRVILSHEFSVKRKFGIAFAIVAMSCGGAIYFNQLTGTLNNYASRLGVDGRSISMLLNKTITLSSSRRSLGAYYWDLIEMKPFTGYGLGGGWINGSSYPHNIYVESILSFGYIFGFVFILIVIALIIIGIKFANNEKQRIIFIFLSLCISLVLSDSFIISPYFYLLIGLCLGETSFENGVVRIGLHESI